MSRGLLAALTGVLEVLNCLLSAGEVPGLFSSEELSKELAALDSKRDKDTHYQVRYQKQQQAGKGL
jgi:hypothetical protein